MGSRNVDRCQNARAHLGVDPDYAAALPSQSSALVLNLNFLDLR